MTDCCAALLRVYLFGYHVVPLLLLCFRISPRSHYHGGRCHVRAVHILDCLVRHCSALLRRLGLRAYILSREICLRHPELRDICDVGQMLYFGWTWVWYITAAMFLLNNTFIQVRLRSSAVSFPC